VDTTVLDNLMMKKNKSEAAKADKLRFRKEWLALVAEIGFNDKTEFYLYVGFPFLGMAPYIDYLSSTDDKQDAIRLLLSGKRLYENKSITFKMILHLLSLLMIEFPEEKLIISQIIKRLPELSINKENRRLGDITRSVHKYFIQVLSPDTDLPDWRVLEIKQNSINSFQTMMAEAITVLLDKRCNSPEELLIIAKTEKWLNSSVRDVESETELCFGSSSKEIGASAETDIGYQTISENEPVRSAVEVKKKHTLHDYLNIAIDAVKHLEREASRFQQECKSYYAEISKLKNKCDHINDVLNREREYNEQQRTEINHLSGEIHTLKQKIASLESILKDRNTEIAERIKLTDMLSRDRDKLFDEAMKRLAAKLKVEFRDFVCAENLPMDADLGENMRLQLKSVFDILKKNGITLD